MPGDPAGESAGRGGVGPASRLALLQSCGILTRVCSWLVGSRRPHVCGNIPEDLNVSGAGGMHFEVPAFAQAAKRPP